jgi:hypothetical protein
MRYQLDVTNRHPKRIEWHKRFLAALAEHPGIGPKPLGELLWPQMTCHPKMRTIQAAVQARRFKTRKFVKIRYGPIRYYLTNLGYEVLSTLIGEQETHTH